MEILYVIYILFCTLILYIMYKMLQSCLITVVREQMFVNHIYQFSDVDVECSIWLEDKTNVKLSCGHHFHEECILKWFAHSVSCPLCRNDV